MNSPAREAGAAQAPPRYDNVILLGAGASADAGIPMLDSFVDKMWEYAIRGKVGDKPLIEADKELLTEANKIRIELDHYSSRAFFDSRNLEDILSLLSFEALDDEKRAKYDTMVRAVARTIELSCIYPYTGPTSVVPGRSGDYGGFWRSLFHQQVQAALPALITFNYDLVFERSLWESFNFEDLENRGKSRSVRLKYYYGMYDCPINGVPQRYSTRDGVIAGQRGDFDWHHKPEIQLPYLKLHGSLNWDRNIFSEPFDRHGCPVIPSGHPTQAVEHPLILPPVFNKTDSPKINSVWKAALSILRHAKNIVIVGYSLPKTDIYMQYFLKSAVGPNSDLQKIIVFDPVLFRGDEKTAQMKQRYKERFSPQFSGRIIFEPAGHVYQSSNSPWGTFRHFTETLRTSPNYLLFYP